MRYEYNGPHCGDGFHISEAYQHHIVMDIAKWPLGVSDEQTAKVYGWITLDIKLTKWLNNNIGASGWNWWIRNQEYIIGFQDKDSAMRFKLSFLEKNQNDR